MEAVAIVLGGFIVVAAASIGVLLRTGLGELSWDALHVRRRHRSVPGWPIGEAPEGELARLTGEVRALEGALTAPLSGRPCVYYAVVILGAQERVMECKSVPFALDDRSGRAIIEPASGTVALTFDHRERVPTLRGPRPEMTALLGRHGIASRGPFGPRPLRFIEGVVEIGRRVEVVGAGIRDARGERPGEAGYRDPLPTSLYVTSSERAPLSISTAVDD